MANSHAGTQNSGNFFSEFNFQIFLLTLNFFIHTVLSIFNSFVKIKNKNSLLYPEYYSKSNYVLITWNVELRKIPPFHIPLFNFKNLKIMRKKKLKFVKRQTQMYEKPNKMSKHIFPHAPHCVNFFFYCTYLVVEPLRKCFISSTTFTLSSNSQVKQEQRGIMQLFFHKIIS